MEAEKLCIHREGKKAYDIVLTDGFAQLAQSVKELGVSDRKICIVTDSNVGPHYREQISDILEGVCSRVCAFTFPAGEESKNLDTVQDLYEYLIRQHFERGDLLAALGGGVVGDLTGYAAATYLRGIRFIQIPTSLLAQVDSSIGGKTGVDFRAYKNMVGAFHQPSLVYSSCQTLLTLTKRQYISGMGEIIKHGLIRDAAYFSWLKENADEICSRSAHVMTPMIKRSDEIKQQVVENDPTEKGERAVLNFGHTIGHAVEKLMNFSMLHGECVAVGMAAAARISLDRGMISEEDFSDILTAIRTFDLPVTVSGISPEEVLATSKSDKKMEKGHVKFILLDGIGRAVIRTDVRDEEILAAARSVIC